MSDFEILIRRNSDAEPDAPHGISIRANSFVLTRLLRNTSKEPNDYLAAPPSQLAFWLVDNWWRLRWECIPPTGMTTEWRLAHDLASIGAFAWPRVVFWGEGNRIGIVSRSDPTGVVGPVRYITNALLFIKGDTFEQGVDRFLTAASSETQGFGSDREALRTQIDALMAERSDPDLTEWRKLEARLGYDLDEAPEVLMETLGELRKRFGAEAVAEAAMAVPGPSAASVLEAEIASAQRLHWQCDLARTAKEVTGVKNDFGEAPWLAAERAAQELRKATGLATGPISNKQLADLLGVRLRALKTVEASTGRELTYGVRLNTGRSRGEVVALSSRWSMDRRFEFSRALADAIWARTDTLGPLTRAKTERQKFQRAFAQSLLCPYDDLKAYVGTEAPSDGAMFAAARHFQVSERLVRTVFVNKGIIDRSQIRRISLDDNAEKLEELVEAA